MPSVDVVLRTTDVDSAQAAGTRELGVPRIDIFESIAAAAPAWDRLAGTALATPFGRRDWIELWQRHIGARARVRPLIAVARNARDEPLFLLPLVCRTGRVFTVAHYFGGRHSQLNMGLWRSDVAAAITAADLAGAFENIAQRCGIDLFLLLNQPAVWDGRRNPLVQLAHQPSPDDVFSVDFAGEG